MLDKAHQDLEEETMKWKKISTELPSTYGEVKQEPPERRCQHGLFRELLHSQFLKIAFFVVASMPSTQH
jgi:hypothetical protein